MRVLGTLDEKNADQNSWMRNASLAFFTAETKMQVMSKGFAITILAVIGFGSIQTSEARTWTQAATGRKIEAEAVKVDGANVVLRMAGGRTVPVPISSLSVEDQNFVKAMAAKPAAGGGGGDWPAFRGPNGTDVSPDTGLLKDWPTDGPEQLWVFDDAGMGYSGFSIVGGKLYTMGTKGEDVHMVCVDISNGEKVWSKSFANDDSKGYSAGWGNGPRGTPSVSGGKVYGLGPKGVLACFDAASGKEIWNKDLVKDYGGKAGGWGFSESPLIDGDKLIIAPGGNRSGIVALNKDTGKEIWTADDVKPGKAEYATIVVTEMNGTRQYVKFFEKIIVSVDASNGKVLWQADFPDGRTAVIPTPIIEGNQVYVAAGYGSGCRAFKIGPDNSVTELWANKNMVNHHGGVIKLGDHLYGFGDGKGLVCQDWNTGEITWMKKDGQFLAKGAVHIADGMIYALNEQNGALTLAEASPSGFEEKGRFVLEPQSSKRNPKGKVWTHPVVIGGKLYLRDQELVHCYNVKG